MNAAELLQNMVERYSSCKSYKDRGRVDGGQGMMTFRTFFARPQKLRFEWACDEEQELSVICCDGQRTLFLDSHSNDHEEEENLSLGIAGATGISQGTAHTIPTLLMPDIEAATGSWTLPKLGPYHLDGYEEVFGKSAAHLVSKRENERTELWIDLNTFALLKYSEWSKSTPESDQELLDAIADMGLEELDSMREHLANQSDEDRQHLTNAFYEEIVFDEPLEETIFTVRPSKLNS